ncbi:hypothetical protein HJFPF1_09157 [Paramyrothecium foliicola]|nr:hypothetical protein HJFPF1_09157 [Paramyrothecium foliicola]
MPGIVEQFTLFNTDIVGLERTLRLLQSICLVIASYPQILIYFFPNDEESAYMFAVTTLFQLSGRLNVIRRTMRLFRFLDSFIAGWRAYTTKEKGSDAWLDIFSKSFWGMFQMVESITLPDLLDVEYLEIFGQERTVEMNNQAQILWFLALFCSASGSCIKLFRTLAYRAVPTTGGGYGTGEEPAQASYTAKDEKKSPAVAVEKETTKAAGLETEREKLKAVVEKRKAERKAMAAEVGGKVSDLVRGVAADVLDMAIPATALGWLDPDSGTIGSIMVVTTILTSIPTWKRYGRELAEKTS